MSYATAKADLHRLVTYQYSLLDGSESGNVPDIFTNSAAYLANYAGDTTQDAVNFETAARAAGIALWQAGVAAIRRQIVAVARSISYPGNDVNGAFAYWVRYMTDTGEFAGGSVSEKFTTRGIVRGTLNSPTNTKLVRVPYDRTGQAIQFGHAEAITATVTSVANAAKFALVLNGTDAGRDVYDQQGSGAAQTLTLETELTSGTPNVSNPNLIQGSPTSQDAGITALTGWKLSDPSHWTVDLVKTYRSNARSMKTAVDGAYISQPIPSYTKLDIPYVPYAIVNPTGFTGSIDLTLGGSSDTTLSVGSDNSWNIVIPANLDGRWFPDQFDTASGVLKFKVNTSAGSIVIGRVGILPLDVFAFGSYWGGMVGATNPILNATATTTDTITVAGKYAHVFALMGLSLPTVGSNPIADPS